MSDDTSAFHECFIQAAVRMTGDYEDRLKKLENEIEKLKALLQTITIDSDVEMVREPWGNTEKLVVNSSVLYNLHNVTVCSDMSIDDIYWDPKTRTLCASSHQ